MKSHCTHTGNALRCLLFLAAALIAFVFTSDKVITESQNSRLNNYSVDSGWSSSDESGNSSEKSGQSGTVYNLELTETPRKQEVAESQSTSVLKTGNNPPEVDSKKLSPDRSVIKNALKLLPNDVRSSLSFRMTIHLLSFFFSLPGDIAINAP